MSKRLITTKDVWPTIAKLLDLDERNIKSLTIIIAGHENTPIKIISEEFLHKDFEPREPIRDLRPDQTIHRQQDVGNRDSALARDDGGRMGG